MWCLENHCNRGNYIHRRGHVELLLYKKDYRRALWINSNRVDGRLHIPPIFLKLHQRIIGEVEKSLFLFFSPSIRQTRTKRRTSVPRFETAQRRSEEGKQNNRSACSRSATKRLTRTNFWNGHELRSTFLLSTTHITAKGGVGKS